MDDRDPIDADGVARAVALLEALATDRGRLARLDAGERRRLLEAAGRLAHPAPDEKRRLHKALRRNDRDRRRARDGELLAATAIRNLPSSPLRLVAQVARLLPAAVADAPRRAAPPSEGAAAQSRRWGTPLPGPTSAGGAEPSQGSAFDHPRELDRPRACYVCKRPYRRLHFFYDALCPSCAELNFAMRTQRANLDGRVALVTGARIKIGYQTVLILLRAGARVVATTRFPRDAATRFSREPDAEKWRDRLDVHGLDLRHLPSVERFARHLERTLPRLDVLVNNAAQTVRRPPGFYHHLLAIEERPPPDEARPFLVAHEALVREVTGEAATPTEALAARGTPAGLVAWQGGARAVGLTDSARLSQLACAPGDEAGPEAFPPGMVDGDRQQVDVRALNSWRMTADLVSTTELLEVHLVNAVAPFVLVARLRRLMARDRTDEKHVINVSAMEASFSRRKKTEKHPHTNMAKASLNMLTRTSAADFARDGVFMNSVDTGWVTDEDPVHHVARKQAVHDFHPPLDAIDGAARVLAPLFDGLRTGHHAFGIFFKDYQPVDW